MRSICLAILLLVSTQPCWAADGEREPPRPGVHLGQQFPDGSVQPGLAATMDIGKRAALSAGIGQSYSGISQNAAGSGQNAERPGAQRFEPSGTVGLTIRF